VVDVTAVYDRKVAAVMAHESQHPDPRGLEAGIREAFSAGARAAGLPEGSQAETFFVLSTA
jgi:LmbE family N-acetylglucosaminyl deacetylase